MIGLDNVYKTYDYKSSAAVVAYARSVHLRHAPGVPQDISHRAQSIDKPENLVLDNINIEVSAGQIFAVIGKSGAGKSTLLRVINQLEVQDAGSVTVAGQRMDLLKPEQLREARRSIGVIFQHFNLLDAYTVYENVALALQVTSLPQAEVKTRVVKMLRLVELEHKSNAYPDQLSGGQKQRVAIARALVSSPKVLLCDEATSALDSESTVQILQLLQKINQQLDLTIFMITHELAVVRRICTQVAVIDQGQVVEQGDTLKVLLQPQHQVTQRLLEHEMAEEESDAIPYDRKITSAVLSGSDNINSDGNVSPKDIAKQSISKVDSELVRLLYVGDETDAPVLSQLQRDYGVEVNILQAKIESISGSRVGHMLCELMGNKDSIIQAKDFLQQHKITIQNVTK